MGRLQNQNISRRGAHASLGGKLFLRRSWTDFHRALSACLAGPGAKEVHRVRTGSRRLQAAIEIVQRSGDRAAKALKKPGRRWLRQASKLRRAAAPVRDLDVHRGMLAPALNAEGRASGMGAEAAGASLGDGAGMGKKGSASGVRERVAGREREAFLAQARALDAWLGERRRTQAETLVRKIQKRGDKLDACAAAFFAAAVFTAMEKSGACAAAGGSAASRVALEDFVRATEAFPSLDAANLHRFRKRTKQARYLAESAGPAGAAAARALKQIQDAIGEWHDWASLAGEAKIAVGGSAPQLAAWLEGNVDRSLERALRVTRRLRSRLLDERARSDRGLDQSRNQSRNSGRAQDRLAVTGRRPPARAASAREDSAAGSGAA